MPHHDKSLIRRAGRIVLRGSLAVVLAGALSWYAALPGNAGPPTTAFDGGGRSPVAEAVYDLGDTSYQDPNITTPIELAAVVHYPAVLGGRPHPLVVIEHGLWWTCADRQAEQVISTTPVPPQVKGGPPLPPAVVQAYAGLSQWPCRPGVTPLPSDSGYDYLAANLGITTDDAQRRPLSLDPRSAVRDQSPLGEFMTEP